jgi:hypothetical protein
MDRKPPESPEILRLVRLAEQSRALLGEEAERLRQKLDVPTRVRESLRHHPGSWMFGSMATGLAASLIFRRRSAESPKKRRGIPATLLGLTLTAARPLAKVWLADQAKRWLSSSAPLDRNRRMVP